MPESKTAKGTITAAAARAGSINILFTCIGRRVSLLNTFRTAAQKLRIKAAFFGTDITELSPALQLCDKRFLVKPISHPKYIKELLQIVKQNKVSLLVPTIDTDLLVLAKHKADFANLGCRALVSDPDVIEICQDKRKTYRFLLKNGFDTPATMSFRTALAKKKLNWPCFMKPWDGYASRGTAVVKNRSELLFFAKRIPNPIVQDFVEGTEHTCDVYVDFSMDVRCVVPRKRIEIRSGEVSKGQVVKNRQLMLLGADLVKVLGAGPGVITLQCFVQKDGRIKVTEINPRFGGGVPLAIKAGANFPKWIIGELLCSRVDSLGRTRQLDRHINVSFDGFSDGLIMLRYDDEVWMG